MVKNSFAGTINGCVLPGTHKALTDKTPRGLVQAPMVSVSQDFCGGGGVTNIL